MIVQVIRVRTTGPAQTEWTDSTAAAHQDLMEHNVKQVIVTDNISNLIIRVNNKTAMFTDIFAYAFLIKEKHIFPQSFLFFSIILSSWPMQVSKERNLGR